MYIIYISTIPIIAINCQLFRISYLSRYKIAKRPTLQARCNLPAIVVIEQVRVSHASDSISIGGVETEGTWDATITRRAEWFDSFNYDTQKRSTRELIARNRPVSRQSAWNPDNQRFGDCRLNSRRAIERGTIGRTYGVPYDALAPNLSSLWSSRRALELIPTTFESRNRSHEHSLIEVSNCIHNVRTAFENFLSSTFSLRGKK